MTDIIKNRSNNSNKAILSRAEVVSTRSSDCSSIWLVQLYENTVRAPFWMRVCAFLGHSSAKVHYAATQLLFRITCTSQMEVTSKNQSVERARDQLYTENDPFPFLRLLCDENRRHTHLWLLEKNGGVLKLASFAVTCRWRSLNEEVALMSMEGTRERLDEMYHFAYDSVFFTGSTAHLHCKEASISHFSFRIFPLLQKDKGRLQTLLSFSAMGTAGKLSCITSQDTK